MKVCPECQARFAGGETFCPHDGAKLVNARELSPGEMTGLELSDAIYLDRLEFADALGERYTGKLTDDDQPVRVTVFNQGYEPSPSRKTDLQEALSALTPALPAEILSLHSIDLDNEPGYVAEEAPRGPSLKTVLEQRKALDWQVAVRVTCAVGRALQYLLERGVILRGLNSQAIFVTKLQDGSIQLGEWAQDILSYCERPLELAEESPEAYLGHAAYLAPEVVRDASDADERSLVYSMGMLLYELIVGKPPFTSKTAAGTLKRHLHEKPLKLSIAQGGAGLHPEIDDVLDMMWIKAAERRFHTPAAAIGALSSLLDEAPDDVAPELSAADEAVFESVQFGQADEAPEDESNDEESSPEESTDEESSDKDAPKVDSAPKKTMAGMPSVSVVGEDDEDDSPGEDTDLDASEEQDQEADEDEVPKEAEQDEPEQDEDDEDAASDESDTPSIIIDDDELRTASENDPDKASESDEASNSDKASESDEASESDAADDSSDEIDDADKKTLMMGTVTGDDDAEDATEEGEDATGTQPMGTVDDDSKQGAEDTEDSDQADEKEEAEEDADGAEAEDEEQSAEDADEEAAEGDEQADDAEEDQDESEETSGSGDPNEDHGEDDEEADKSSSDSSAMEIGFVDAKNDGGGEFGDDWFSSGADNVWDQSRLSEHQEKAETLRKYVTIGIFVLLGLGSIGLYFFFENYSGEATEEELAAAENDEDEDVEEQEQVDVDALRADFDRAFEAGQLIRPFRGSAVSFLELLKKNARGDERYEEAREQFVRAASEKARELEAKQLRHARDLAGYASQFAPDDKELAAYTESLHQRMIDGDAGNASADAGTPKPTQKPEATKTVASAKETDSATGARKDRNSGSSGQGSAQKRTDDSEKEAPTRTVADILREASAAEKANQKDKAISLYTEAIKRSPANHTAHAKLGDLLFHKAAYSQAVKHHKEATLLRPNNAAYSVTLGRTYFKLGRYQQAHDMWKKALTQDPNNKTAKTYLRLVKDKL